jgi:hypothetical protein
MLGLRRDTSPGTRDTGAGAYPGSYWVWRRLPLEWRM